MATVRTVTVTPSGPVGGEDANYASLSAALAAEAANLVSLDRQLDVACYAMEDTTPASVTGYSTDATRYIRIYAPAGQRHDGKWSTSAYRLVTTSSTTSLSINESFVRVEGLQVHQAATGQRSAVAFTGVAPEADLVLDGCLFKSSSTSGIVDRGVVANVTVTALASVVFRNTVFYGGNSQSGLYVGGGTVGADNCVFVSHGTYGVNAAAGTVTLRNCYAGAAGTDAYNGTMTRTTCAHSSATVFAGSTASVAHDGATFVSVTGGSEDYHLVSGSPLADAGTDLSTDFTTDIDGDTRAGTWDIGVDSFESSPFTAGVASFVSSGTAGVVVGATAHSNGTEPVTRVWQRSTTGAGGFSDLADGGGVSGSTTLTLTDGSAVAGPLYSYRLKYVDDGASEVFSNQASARLYQGGQFPSAGSGGGVGRRSF